MDGKAISVIYNSIHIVGQRCICYACIEIYWQKRYLCLLWWPPRSRLTALEIHWWFLLLLSWLPSFSYLSHAVCFLFPPIVFGKLLCLMIWSGYCNYVSLPLLPSPPPSQPSFSKQPSIKTDGQLLLISSSTHVDESSSYVPPQFLFRAT